MQRQPNRSRLVALALSFALSAPVVAADEPAAPGPKRRADGFEVVDLEVGTGAVASAGKLVIVQFVGKLADGRAFANTYETKRPLRFLLGKGQVVQGFDDAVNGMKVGGRRRAIVPPKLGYGEKGFGTLVPPDAPLSFEIELVAVRDKP